MGRLIDISSKPYALRLRENIRRSGVAKTEAEAQVIIKNNVLESGKALSELPSIWFSSTEAILARMRKVHGWELVEDELAKGKGLLMMTPHIGCFEIIPHFLSTKFPFTALYRPPKLAFLDPLMRSGRSRAGVNLAKTDLSGVRVLFKALKRGEAVGILPDQVPKKGDGEWAEFFGRPAYTMTMWSKLAEKSGAGTILMFTKRLDKGRGYELFFKPMPQVVAGESKSRHLNKGLEQIISENPEQFLWSYNRHKGSISP